MPSASTPSVAAGAWWLIGAHGSSRRGCAGRGAVRRQAARTGRSAPGGHNAGLSPSPPRQPPDPRGSADATPALCPRTAPGDRASTGCRSDGRPPTQRLRSPRATAGRPHADCPTGHGGPPPSRPPDGHDAGLRPRPPHQRPPPTCAARTTPALCPREAPDEWGEHRVQELCSDPLESRSAWNARGGGCTWHPPPLAFGPRLSASRRPRRSAWPRDA